MVESVESGVYDCTISAITYPNQVLTSSILNKTYLTKIFGCPSICSKENIPNPNILDPYIAHDIAPSLCITNTKHEGSVTPSFQH